MKRDFNTYFLQTNRTYAYRIKSVVPFGDFGKNEAERAEHLVRLERIERVLGRFEPLSIKPVQRTIIQSQPLDFGHLTNREVYILDVVLNYPCAGYVLHDLIKRAAGIPNDHLVVLGENDPRAIEAAIKDAEDDIEQEAKEKGLTSVAKLSDPDYLEAPEAPDDLYGNEANARFLSYLAASRKNALGDVPDDVNTEDFNAHILDAPKVKPAPFEKEEGEDGITVKRVFKDEKGNIHTITRTVETKSAAKKVD